MEADNLTNIMITTLKKYGFLERGYKLGSLSWTNNWTGKESSVGISCEISDQESYINLTYSVTDSEGNQKNLNYKIQLDSTPCYYGGKRYWFVCPLYKNGGACNRRVGALYLGGDYFGCRHCYELTYSSRNKNRNWKYSYLTKILDATMKVDSIRDKMKRITYAGKPTKNCQRIMKINKKLRPAIELFDKSK